LGYTKPNKIHSIVGLYLLRKYSHTCI